MYKTFYDWLHEPAPDWKQNLECCDLRVFRELDMEREEVEKILEILDEFGVFKKIERDD